MTTKRIINSIKDIIIFINNYIYMNIINKINDIEFSNKFIQYNETYITRLTKYRNKNNDNDNRITSMSVLTNKNYDNKKCNNSDNKKTQHIEHKNMFWFIYIIIHGVEEYNLINKRLQVERDNRYKLIETIQKEEKLLKSHKFKCADIINDLGNLNPITFNTLKALCICLNINICLKQKKLCEIHKNNDKDKIYIIDCFNNSLILEPQMETNIMKSNLVVKSLEKPFYSISKYKVCELKELCLKLELLNLEEINGNIKLKKNDYYRKLIEYNSLY